MRESEFQGKLIKKIKNMFPGSIVMKNDANYIQGIPDLSVLYKDKWAALEVKIAEDAKRQPNQEYYVEKMNQMSFSRVIYPENENEVLGQLSLFFGKD